MNNQPKAGKITMFMSVEELMAESEKHRQEMDREVVIEDGYIGFPRYDYWIRLSRVNSYKSMIRRVTHLLEKEWVSRDMLLTFIEKAGSHHRLHVHSDG